MRFYRELQQRIAFLAIGRSALRNQGALGIIKISRDFCSSINLRVMAKKWNDNDFDSFLNANTKALQKQFPNDAKNNFGAARKALNLFFRDVVYNTFLTKHYKISLSQSHLRQLELPLDKDTSSEIIKRYPSIKWFWGGIKYLSKECSDIFQSAAAIISKKKKLPRIHLDVSFWSGDK